MPIAQKNIETQAYVLVLNWNGWADTIECLESIFRSNYPHRVVVCDNNSSDNSIEKICLWAESRLNIIKPRDFLMTSLTFPPITKPISYVVYNKAQAEAGGFPVDDAKLVLINTGANLGFAGGNNVGLRYILARNDAKFIWLLNNDTVVKKDALSNLATSLQNNFMAGICGATIFYYHDPSRIQCLGGCTYDRLFGIARNIGYMLHKSELEKIDFADIKLDYVMGASMMITLEFLKNIGCMDEDYFLYYEEIDWAIRAKKHNFELIYSPASIVYHKEGASIIGKQKSNVKASFRSDYFLITNRIKFTKKHFIFSLPQIYIGLLVTFLVRLLRAQFSRAIFMLFVPFLGNRYLNDLKKLNQNIRSEE